MFSTIRSRMWLSYILLTGVILCILGITLTIYLLRNPFESRQTLQRLRFITTLVVQRAPSFSKLDTTQLIAIVQRIDNNYDVRVIVFNKTGEFIVDSRSNSAGSIPSVSFLLDNKRIFTNYYFRDSNGKVWIYVVRPLLGGNILVVTAPRPKTPIISIVRDEFFLPLVSAGAIALLLALILAFWMARWVSTPLQKMALASKQVADGKYNHIVPQGPNEVRHLAQAFNEMADRVQVSQKAQRDFVANVSHEMKTPLTSIQGFTQAILDGTINSQDALKQAVEVIYTEAGRMHRLVVDLLDLAKLDGGIAELEYIPLSLANLLRDVIDKFAPLAIRSKVIIKDQIGILPIIKGDSDRLAQVFTNLIDNALKHSPSSGEITIEAMHQNSYIEVAISDQGTGIPQEDLSRVFERFYQTDKSRPGGGERGSGLGLSIAKEIVLAHRGDIFAVNNESREYRGRGCTFIVRLPVVPLGDEI